MKIIWEDDFGLMEILVDDLGIDFRSQRGYAVFSDRHGAEYTVPVSDIISITY